MEIRKYAAFDVIGNSCDPKSKCSSKDEPIIKCYCCVYGMCVHGMCVYVYNICGHKTNAYFSLLYDKDLCQTLISNGLMQQKHI
jgi:hypothetical protein